MTADEDPSTLHPAMWCGTCRLPPDGTHDREIIDRFADYLRGTSLPPDENRPSCDRCGGWLDWCKGLCP